MPKTTEDKIREEARRQVQELLASAGVDQGRAALEVLYLLPIEFVRMYMELFDMALRWNPSGSNQGSKNSEGDIKAKGRADAKHPMHTRHMQVGGGGGKRWVERQWQVKMPEALDEKTKLDRRIVKGAADAIRAARDKNSTSSALSDVERNRSRGEKSDNRCGTCGRGLATGWVRCPFHA